MRIAILNEIGLDATHGDRLRALGSLRFDGDTTQPSVALERIRGADIAVIDGFKVPVTRELLEAGDDLRLLVLTSTAFHMVDFAAAGERNIKVANIAGYSTEAVAEHAIALLFATIRAIPQADRAMRAAPFQIDPGREAHRAYLGHELRDKTLGVVGLGEIGRRVAELGIALGMQVLGYNRTLRPVPGVRSVGLDELLRLSDVVSLNLAVHPETEDIISDRELSLMKPKAVLINTAGGELVDSAALYRALAAGRLGGAGLDVISPWDGSNPLLALDSVVLSPQSAAWTREACTNLSEAVVATIEAFVRGSPINLVN
jgi:phosphoglycerate dehydrogenase-like enzyme